MIEEWCRNLTSIDRVILRSMFMSNARIHIYFFHKKYLFSPLQIIESLEKLKLSKLIEFNQHYCNLTEFGKRQILKNRRLVFASKIVRHWSQLPQEHSLPPRLPSAPYLPKLDRIDLKFFGKKY
jgi:hypothetical protein